MAENEAKQPTLEDVRNWPATVGVARASLAFGFSRSHGYERVREGTFPARLLNDKPPFRVVTASIVQALSPGGHAAGS